VNLEQAIHQRWAASEPLASLLPAERVKTGRSFGHTVPYATIERRTSRTAFRTNAGDALDEVTLQITVWHDDHDAGWAVIDQIKATFDLRDFALSGGDRVARMRRTGDSATQHDDGTWQLSIDFTVRISLPSGV
jgi:hypothetical protein